MKARPVEYEASVAEVRQETHDTVTLVLDTDAQRLEYQAGQFVDVDPHQFRAISRVIAYLEDHKKRREPARSYSMSSAPHEPHLAITIKDEEYVPGQTLYPPVLSPYLVHGRLAGSRLRFRGFMGPYVLPLDVEARTEHVVHIVAGTGAVPNFSIVKDALNRGLALRHTFLSSNKTWGDVLFREELEALERAHPERLRVVHALTRETNEERFGPKVRRGRLSRELFEELVPDHARCLFYVCGPAITPWERRKALETRIPATPRFMEAVLGHLHSMGVEEKRIKREAYG